MSHILTGLRSVSVSIALFAALTAHAVAGPTEQPQSNASASSKGKAAQSPMTNRVASSAPYPVRFKITSFLARQHAREGNRQRALTEYHSMLSVDDPAWPENEAGDAFRIARDMEVARMMAESGFYDHSVRVLETALLLARVNKDSQEVAIERQLQSTVEIAQAKGITVPMALLNDERLNEVVAQLTTQNQPGAQPTPAEMDLPAGATTESPTTTTAEATAPLTQPAPIASTENGPAVSPDVSPSYCSACGRHHHHHHTASSPQTDRIRPVASDGAGSAKDSGWRSLLSRRKSPSTTTKTSDVEPTADVDESPTLPKSQARSTALSRLLGKRTDAAKRSAATAVASDSSNTPVQAESPPTSDEIAATAVAEAPTIEPTPAPAAKKPSVLRRLLGKKQEPKRGAAPAPKADQPIESEVMAAGHEVTEATEAEAETPGSVVPAVHERPIQESTPAPAEQSPEPAGPTVDPTLDAPAPAEAADQRLPDVTTKTAEVTRIQVGVAGQVNRPGIFTFDGEACSVEAILLRAGQKSPSTDKHVRVIRITEPASDVDTGDDLSTHVQGREIVLVDGAGARPLYVAVMPYFILQVPVSHGRATTAAQILEKLAAHWPNVRTQRMGLVRYDNQTSGLAVTTLQQLDGQTDEPLHHGDVLYIDGTGLDPDQVLPAAKAIANTAGANLRQTK
jgi:hypothetical protein